MGNFDYSQFRSGNVYPLQNPIDQGRGVYRKNADPRENGANGRMTNQKGEEIDFFIEEIESSFSMTGSTAQSRNVREFMPHNIVQPVIKVTGIAPSNFEYNRMAGFVRASQYFAVNYGEDTREVLTTSGKKVRTETVRLWIKNGQAPKVWNGSKTKGGEGGAEGRHVKGVHVPWQVEGYIKSMRAGGERFNYAPKFEFEFYVAQSIFKQGDTNMGMWEDTRVYGAELKPWLDWIGTTGMVEGSKASTDTLDAKEKKNNNKQEWGGNHDPGSNPFEVPNFGEEPETDTAEVDGPPAPKKNIFE